jgi:hypothetical protein
MDAAGNVMKGSAANAAVAVSLMFPSEVAIEIYLNYLCRVLMFSIMARNRAVGETFRPPVAGVRTVTELGKGMPPPRLACPSALYH